MTASTSISAAPSSHHPAWLLTGGLTAVAWVVLVAWIRSPWEHLLDHEGSESLAPAMALLVFITVWTLMLAAMMLPSTTPLVRLFSRVVAGRDDRRRLVAALLAGYSTVWVLAGLIAYSGDRALHAADEAWSIFGDRGWVLVVTALAGAGAFQFSALKERCLTRCRTPAGVIVTGWRGKAPTAEAFRIGTNHGWTCVGCCSALMLIMFALGAANLALLVGLSTVMTIEKVPSWGAAITRPVGVSLLVVAAAIAVAHL